MSASTTGASQACRPSQRRRWAAPYMPVARISRGTRSRCRHYVRVPNKHPRHPVETTARAAEARDEGAFLGDLVKLRRFETRRQRKLDRLVLRIGDR